VTDLDWSAIGRSEEFTGLPLGAYWLANLVFFGVGEEIGWRGFLQPELEGRHPRVLAANLVAIVWAIWHLPLFGVTPSYRATPAVGLVGFAASIWVASWIFAWLLDMGRGSRLVVAVFHAWFDITTTSPLEPNMLPTAMSAGITVIGLLILRHMLVAEHAVDRVRPEHATARHGR
jgi:membrane protease YdiL (CAAX protease family)